MGSSLDGTGDGTTMVDSMSTDDDDVTSCVTNADVAAMTAMRVTLTCSGVAEGVYGPVGMSTYNADNENSP
jgi:hypothetical protein